MGDAEIRDDGAPAVIEDVFRLEVAVYHFRLMRYVKRLEYFVE